MTQIPGHIRYLLLFHKFVSVEGLGTFCTKYRKAFYNKSEGIFNPPQFIVSFVPDNLEGDELLEKSISRKEKVSLNEARESIRYFVDFVKTAVNWNDSVKIPGLGILRKDADHKIELISAEEGQKYQNLRGLSPISL